MAGIILLIWTGCTDKADFMYQDRSEELQANVESYLSTRTVKVEVPEGKMAIVRNGEEVIATLTKTSHIIVPKGETAQAQSRATITLPDTPVTIEYIDNSGSKGQGFNGEDANTTGSHPYPFEENSNCLKQTVAFEDDINGGDHDYNDLVINATVLIPTQGGELKMLINPLALGSTFSIKLGFRYNGTDYWITQSDCRSELFGGAGGFLNTVKDAPLKKYPIIEKTFTVTEMTEDSAIDWFIEVKGTRLYAVNRFNKQWIDNKMLPYGFALTYVMAPSSAVNTSAYLVRESDHSQAWYTYRTVGRDKDGNIVANCSSYNTGKAAYIKPNSWWNWPAENVSIDKVYPFFTKVFLNGSSSYIGNDEKATIDKTLLSTYSYQNKAIKANAINAIGSERGQYYSSTEYKNNYDICTPSQPYMVLEEIEKGLYFREELKFFQYALFGTWATKSKYDRVTETWFNGWISQGISCQGLDEKGRVVMESIAWWCKDKNDTQMKDELAKKYPYPGK